MIQYQKILLTLVALFAISTGAWAQQKYNVTFSGLDNTACNTTFTDVTLPYSKSFGKSDACSNAYDIDGSSNNELVGASFGGDNFTITVQKAFEGTVTVSVGGETESFDPYSRNITVACVPAAPSLAVTWNAATKTATFEMPAYDVEIAPIYAPLAKWATEGDAVLTPTAIEGIYAGTTDAIVKAGTVATGQGTVMYFATTEQLTAEQALKANGWLSTLPTAADIADDGATVYVWYYIAGADTPDGQEATAENTFNDSEICAEPLEVIVLSNKFDLTFNAANANTIEAGKATVKVGDAAATVTEGKLQGVKMGSKVTINAKQGYKFRKVEAKKGAAGPKYADVVTICEKNGDNKYLISSFFDGTNANITTITKEEAIALAEYLGGGNIRVVYEEYEFYGDRYVRTTNAAGNVSGASLSTTNTSNVPLYYVPAGN